MKNHDVSRNTLTDVTLRLICRLAGMALSGTLFITAQARAELPVATQPGDINYRWDGADVPVIDGNQLQINQTARNALLHWRSFNIDPGNTVRFSQPSSSSVALNRIFQDDPSRILGNLEANGQVFLINQNGFLFGPDANVDVNTLVASTLDIDDRIFEDVGLVGAIDQEGNLPAFQGNGEMGAIEIAEGARLQSRDGGRVMILAPMIENRGTIKTPGGQAVLAASQDRVYLAASSDPDLRGLLVEVETGGDVNNLGEIIAERGNVSLLGLAVNQQGLVRATTSATLNGSVRLVAQDRVVFSGATNKIPEATRAGTLTVGGSVEVLLDDASAGEQAPDSQIQPRSQIELSGEQVTIEADARITAPSAEVQIQAVRDPRTIRSISRLPEEGVSLRIDEGAVIDVSGTDDAVLSVADNVIEVEARGGELADSPLQRDGVLRGETLRVDVRKDSPLLDISGAVNNIQRTTRERLSTGGNITLQSDGDLLTGAGSVIDISGGQVTFTGDQVSTTRLVTDDLDVIDISEAEPGRRYLGLVGDIEVRHDKWGIVESFSSSAFSHYEAGYVEGRDAGTLTVNSPRLAFGSEIRAGSVTGRWQRQAVQQLADGEHRPFDQRPFGGRADILLRTSETGFLPSVAVSPDAALIPVPAPGSGVDPLLPVTLSAAMLNQSGLGHIRLESPGELRIDAGGSLDLALDTVLEMEAGRVAFNDAMRLPGGRISATAATTSTVLPEDVAIDVAPGVSLDVSGVWTNDNPLLAGSDSAAQVVVNGGTITLDAAGSLRLAEGSRLNADAGAWLQVDGTLNGGKGGSIALSSVTDGTVPAEFILDGKSSARGFTDNGDFSLAADGFTFEGDSIAPGVSLPLDGFGSYRFTAKRDGVVVTPGTRLVLRQRNLQLRPDAFSQRSGETVPADTLLLPDYERRPVDLTLESRRSNVSLREPLIDIGTGAVIEGDPGARIALRSDTSLYVDGQLTANAGEMTLAIEPNGIDGYLAEQKIWLGDNARLDVSGQYIARPDDLGRRIGQVLDAGTVRIEANRGSIVTRPGSWIDVHGVAATLDLPVASESPLALRFEPVEVAGRAGRVEMLAAETALLQGAYDAQVAAPEAEGGRFSFQLDPGRRGQLSLLEELSFPPEQRFPHTLRTLRLVEYAGTLPEADAALPEMENGVAYIPAERLLDSGFSSLALSSRPDRLGGLLQTPDSLAAIRFDRDLTLDAGRALVLDAPLFVNTGAEVRLSAPYVAIGSTFNTFVDGAIPQSEVNRGTNQPVRVAPTPGDGRLAVSADLVDISGHSTWQGFGSEDRDGLDIASRGDIRLRGQLMRTNDVDTELTGALRSAADIRLSAQQIYPSTLTRFDLRVEDAEAGRIRIDRVPGLAGQVLSAGGRLTLHAPIIEQAGVLQAPFGELQLEAAQRIDLLPGSLVSVTGKGLQVPFGQLQFQTDLTFFLGEATDLPGAPPARLIRLAAPAVDLAKGAQLDLSGGGDARAWEFVPGPGGSRDILLADLDPDAAVEANPSFAILPQLNSEFAPWDPLESPQAETVQDIRVGDTLYLEAGAGIEAGQYAILPARYALYGGYLVTPVSGSQDLVPGSAARRADGAPMLAGRRGVAGTDLIESRWQGYAIEDGSQVRLRAEYVEKNLDTLFPDAATRSDDAGRLSIHASEALNLGAGLLPNLAGGRGAQVDISAESLRVVTQRQSAGIELTANDLSALGAESLLLGGFREDVGDTVQVTPTAQQLVVEDGVDLALPELILVAGDLYLGEGGQTNLRTTGTALRAGADLDIRGDAAIVAVSSRRGLQARRNQVPAPPTATLAIGEGTRLLADDGGLILDSPTDLTLAGELSARNGSLQLGANAVSLGETDGLGLSGLVLDNATLAGLQGTDLTLRSSGQVDLYGTLEDVSGNLIRFGSIDLDAAGLVGHALQGRSAVLSGGQIELSNFSDRTAFAAENAGGDFLLQTGDLTLDGLLEGPGFALKGFTDNRIQANSRVHFQAGGRLSTDADLVINTPLLTAASGSQGALDVSGGLTLEGADSRDETARSEAGLAARLDMNADAITLDTAVSLPSGSVSLTAAGPGDITLLTGAELDVSGRDEHFDTALLGTPGGEIRLLALQGDVRLQGGRLDVSAAPAGGAGGRLVVEAGNGAIAFGDVSLEGRSMDGEDGAGYRFDALAMHRTDGSGEGSLSPLLASLTAGDFSAEQVIRVRDGDLLLAQDESLVARHVALSADQGDLIFAGDIDASGADGGRIELAAGDTLMLSGVLDASANADGGEAGRIALVALDADGDGQSRLEADSEARLELNGGGVLQLYVPAGADDSLIGLQPFGAQINGAAGREVVAVRVLDNPGQNTTTGQSTLTLAALSAEFSTMDVFQRAAQVRLPAGFRLRPALDVRAEGDLRLAEDVDLLDVRFGTDDVPGMLMLRAGGDLVFDGSLTDGVIETTSPLFGTPETRISSGESWAYVLSSGADTAAASLLSTAANADVLLNGGSLVRSGTGDIQVVSGGDVRLAEGSAIYTIGRDAGAGAFGDVIFPQLNNLDGNGILYTLTGSIQFGQGGGDVRISALGDITGAGVAGLNQAWQPKVGGDYNNVLPGIGELPVIRGVSVNDFTDGVGVLGGGHMQLTAGRNVRDLNLVMPGSIRPGNNLGVVSSPSATRIEQRADTQLERAGGNLLEVRAGRDLSDFYLQADQGRVRVSAGRDIAASETGSILLGIGDADVSLVAGNRLFINNSFDPGLIEQSAPQFLLVQRLIPNVRGVDTLFLTQSDNARLSLTSLAGDAVYEASTQAVVDRLSPSALSSGETTDLLSRNIVPARLELQSIEGDVRIDGQKLTVLPAADGRIRVLAGNDIVLRDSIALVQADADPALLPDARFPVVLGSGQLLDTLTSTSSQFHALSPVYENSTRSNQLVARSGDIRRSGDESQKSSLVFSNQTRLVAGRDILGQNVSIQHANAQQVSYIDAGRDIRQATLRDRTSGALASNDRRSFTVAGPGYILFQAGRSIDLGATAGIESIGDNANTVLPDEGASISILAGHRGEPDYTAFTARYVDADDTYIPLLRDFLGSIGVTTETGSEARAALSTIDPLQRNRFLYKVLFSELKASGLDATEGNTGDYSRGFDAIGILFPAPDPDGRLDIKLSKIFTLDGGDIDLLVPGGLIDGGATSSTVLTKAPDELGVVTGRAGDINAFVDGDFLVNQSRVFALEGDLLMWSSNGDIDAGRGAKTALASPPPVTRIDPQTGQTVVEFPPNISGSGLLGVNGFLFAPRGAINAGDAGIQATGNLTLGAVEVIGADNINVGGISVGVPVANAAGLAAGLTGVSNVASSATKQAETSTASLASVEEGYADEEVGLLTVEILGFGE